jgi:hypothetical protein
MVPAAVVSSSAARALHFIYFPTTIQTSGNWGQSIGQYSVSSGKPSVMCKVLWLVISGVLTDNSLGLVWRALAPLSVWDCACKSVRCFVRRFLFLDFPDFIFCFCWFCFILFFLDFPDFIFKHWQFKIRPHWSRTSPGFPMRTNLKLSMFKYKIRKIQKK